MPDLDGARLDGDRIRRLAGLLKEAERPIRVLRTVAWPPEVRERFFAAGARELPRVEYERPEVAGSTERLAEVRRALDPAAPVDAWLARVADKVALSADMLAGVGTRQLYLRSRELYGGPEDPLDDGVSTSLGLAKQLDSILQSVAHLDLGAPEPACHLASSVAEAIRKAANDLFGDRAPEVVVVEHLSSNALAGPKAIRVRRTACFADRDVAQLIHHEAYIHVATSLNGMAQVDVPILGAGHAGTTRTQEGLAVFAELISSTLDPARFRRLADRVLAIQMSIDGADFLEVFRFFGGRGYEPEQAFESTRRVFRGGVLTGGAPFTKDVVYLDGLLRVHNFLRAAVAAGRTDCLHLLFCGKLAIEDLPALGRLAAAGLVRAPPFLPPWASDLRFLVAYLAYSAFLNRVNLAELRRHLDALLGDIPRFDRGVGEASV